MHEIDKAGVFFAFSFPKSDKNLTLVALQKIY